MKQILRQKSPLLPLMPHLHSFFSRAKRHSISLHVIYPHTLIKRHLNNQIGEMGQTMSHEPPMPPTLPAPSPNTHSLSTSSSPSVNSSDNTIQAILYSLDENIRQQKPDGTWREYQRLRQNYTDVSEIGISKLLDVLDVVARKTGLSHARTNRISHLVHEIRSLSLNYVTCNNLVSKLSKYSCFDLADEMIDEMNASHTPVFSSTIVHLISRLMMKRHVERAMSVFEEFRKSGGRLDSHLMSTLVEGLVRNDDTAAALQWHELMQESGLRLSAAAYRQFIRCYSTANDFTEALKWHEKMIACGHPSDVALCSVFIYSYAKCEEWEKAEEWFEQSLNCLPSPSNPAESLHAQQWKEAAYLRDKTHSHTLMISVFCKQALFHKALQLFHRMRFEGPPPDNSTCNAIVHGLARSDRLEEARALFDEMPTMGLSPCNICFTILIDAYAKAGNLKMSLELMERMKEADVAADEITYTALMDGISKSGDIYKAMSLYHEMKRLGIPIDAQACTVLLFGNARFWNVEGTVEVFEDLKSLDVELNSYTYTALIFGYARNGSMSNALALLQEMHDKGVERTVHAYNAILNGYAEEGDLESMQTYVRKMKEDDVAPVLVTYNILMTAYSKAGDCETVLRLFNLLIKDQDFQNVDNHTLCIVLKTLSAHGHIDIVRNLFEALRNSEHFILNIDTWNRYILSLIHNGAYVEANDTLFQLLDNHVSLEPVHMRSIIAVLRVKERWDELDDLMAHLTDRFPQLAYDLQRNTINS